MEQANQVINQVTYLETAMEQANQVKVINLVTITR